MLVAHMPLPMVLPLKPFLLVRTPESTAVKLLAGVFVVLLLMPSQVLGVQEGFVTFVAYESPLAVIALVVSQSVVRVESLLAFCAAECGRLVAHLDWGAPGAAHRRRRGGCADGWRGLLRSVGDLQMGVDAEVGGDNL